VKKIRIDDCICHSHIDNHYKIKDKILSIIKERDDYKQDNISKLDFSNSTDLERDWVKIFLPEFSKSLIKVIRSLAYRGIRLNQVWYQQYLDGGDHGWHIHGGHYTGVYYLEYPEGSAKTEICSPYNFKNKQIDVTEGDFIIFPAHWMHRGMVNNTERKTIISYNFNILVDDLPTLDFDVILSEHKKSESNTSL